MLRAFNRYKRFRSTPESFLTYSSGAAGDNFGRSVALSKDGNTLAVGADLDDVGANTNQGSVTIFTRSSSTWTQQAYLTYSGGAANDKFGYSVALSSDGNTLAVGAYTDTVGANNAQGSCIVFTRSGSTWTEQAFLTYSSGAASDQFGYSVSLSNDGNTLAVGAVTDNVGANTDQGSCTIFTRSGSTWTQQAYLTYSGGAGSDFFGYSVALNSDGNVLAVGAYNDTVGTNAGQGSVTIFTRSGSIWSEQSYLTAIGGAAGDAFGYRVSISGDGGHLVVGAAGDAIGANTSQGSVRYFNYGLGVWTERQTITYSAGAADDTFGASVAISDNGTVLAVGAPVDDISANTDQGSVTIFTRTFNQWYEQKYLSYSSGAANDEFGRSVSLNNNGTILAVGNRFDDVGANTGQGSCLVYYRR